jgi:alkylation response protein AidB-like acyl-CoA dehydrogenase
VDTLNFAPTPEQLQIRDAMRDFLAVRSPLTVARAHLDDAADRNDRGLWNDLRQQFGAQGLMVPEELGGLGLGLDDLTMVLSAMGEALVPGPYFATVALATPILLAASPDEVRDRTLHGIAEGRLRVALAYLSSEGATLSRGVFAAKTGGRWHLSGRAGLVLDADIADVLVVAADSIDGLQLFVVDDISALQVSAAGSIDPTRQVFNVEFETVPATPLALPTSAEEVVEAGLDQARVAMAAEQVGTARRCLDRTVEFVKQRTQFGKPIGAFQAVQHTCADSLLDIEGAESAVMYAAWAHRDGAPEFPRAAAVAKIAASDAGLTAATNFVHLSGTMGYTREYDAQLFYRRAKWCSLFLGSAAQHRSRLAGMIGV